jgi:glucoamylase
MNAPENSIAFGAPGIEPRWTSSAKESVGTSYHTSCRVWFTLSHGIVNEIYYPHVDQPNTRDFQFLISDGETFCHEEKRDLTHAIDYPERDCLFYRLTNSEPDGRYRIIKDVFADPHQSVLLVHTKVEVLGESLRRKLRLYALLAPHIAGFGAGNSGWCAEVGGIKLIKAQRENVHLIMACSSGFSRRSVGYVGFSDGWQDLMHNFKMDWQFQEAEKGNIALTGEINLPGSGEFHSCSRIWPQLPEHNRQVVPIAGRVVRIASSGICPAMAACGCESKIRLQRGHIRRRRNVSTKPLRVAGA